MNKLKRNRIVVYTISLMLVVAGYLNYIENNDAIEISSTNTQNTTNIGDATLVSNNEAVEGEKKEEINNEENNTTESNGGSLSENTENNIADTNSNINVTIDEDDEYFANSKLEREKMYSQMLETYQKMLENTAISEEQKSIASNEITNINNTRNSIMICENLIAIKGFEEAVILANGESVNIVIKAKQLSTEEIAQIQNIITREMGATIENIHIMKK